MRYRRRRQQPTTDPRGGTPQKRPKSSQVKAALSVLLPGTAGLALLAVATGEWFAELAVLLFVLVGFDIVLLWLAYSHDPRRG